MQLGWAAWHVPGSGGRADSQRSLLGRDWRALTAQRPVLCEWRWRREWKEPADVLESQAEQHLGWGRLGQQPVPRHTARSHLCACLLVSMPLTLTPAGRISVRAGTR